MPENVQLLKCPLCSASLVREGGSLLCLGARRHCFDISSKGYVNFALNSRGGDSCEAVSARHLFLQAGYYDEAASAVVRMLKKHLASGAVLDAGCGEGYYTGRIAGSGAYRVLGTDLSKAAVEQGAKDSARAGLSVDYFVSNLFAMPVADEAVDCVVNIFAPCAEAEFLRVLKPGGLLILAGAGPRHLWELKQAVYADVYENGERKDLPQRMEPVETEKASFTIRVGEEHIGALFAMTPYYWRTSPADMQKLKDMQTLTTTVEFLLHVFRKAGDFE